MQSPLFPSELDQEAFIKNKGLFGEILGAGALGALFGISGGLFFTGFQARKLAGSADQIVTLVEEFKTDFDVVKSKVNRVIGVVEEVLSEVRDIVGQIGEILDENSIRQAQTDIGTFIGLIDDYTSNGEKHFKNNINEVKSVCRDLAKSMARIQASKSSRLEKFVLTASPLAVWSYATQLTLAAERDGPSIDYRELSVFKNTVGENLSFLEEMSNLHKSVQSFDGGVQVQEKRLYFYLSVPSMIDKHGPLFDYSKHVPA